MKLFMNKSEYNINVTIEEEKKIKKTAILPVRLKWRSPMYLNVGIWGIGSFFLFYFEFFSSEIITNSFIYLVVFNYAWLKTLELAYYTSKESFRN